MPSKERNNINFISQAGQVPQDVHPTNGSEMDANKSNHNVVDNLDAAQTDDIT
jgi:hypothetical protein